MFICFICKLTLGSCKALFLHFKFIHNLGLYDEYSCNQSDCTRKFQNIRSFRRHLQNHLSDTTAISNADVLDQNPCTSTKQNSDFLKNNEPSELATLPQNNSINDYNKSIESFVLSLYSNPELNRKTSTQILSNIREDIINKICNVIKDEFIKKNTSNVDKECLQNLLQAFNEPLKQLDTEYKVLQWFKNKDVFVTPEQITINNVLQPCLRNGIVTIQPKDITVTRVNLPLIFKKIFELPNILNVALENMNILSKQCNRNNSYSNFIQGDLWKIRTHSKEKKPIIPYFLYFDEFESGNPLGSHAGEQTIAATYFNFPVLPSELLSSLNSIFVAMLFNSSLKCEGNNVLFHTIIQQLKELQDQGVEIETPSGAVRVYFMLGLILGDNLGINDILGYSKSFSSHFYCRFCKAPKSMMCKQIRQDDSLLRNRENYCEDVAVNDVTKTGINYESNFNTIDSFHVVDNLSVDIMHDIFEGVCHYDLGNIITHYIDIKLFSLSTLNNRIQLFDYSFSELDDRPRLIKQNQLIKKKFKMSASEMMCFIHLFPLFIGDLIPEGDNVWEILIALLKIIDIIMTRDIDHSSLKYLEYLIAEHHDLYLHNFNDTLKPKHHFMVHYPHIIKNTGPLRNMWCMRFEAKHKLLKQTATNTRSRRNLPYTLMIKEQLALAHRIYTKQGLDKSIIRGSNDLNKISKICENIPLHIDLNLYTDNLKWVIVKGIKYVIGIILSLCQEDGIYFYKIEHILSSANDDVCFVCEKLDGIGYNEHLQAYDLTLSTVSEIVKLNPLDLIASPTASHVMSNGDKYCRIKYL